MEVALRILVLLEVASPSHPNDNQHVSLHRLYPQICGTCTYAQLHSHVGRTFLPEDAASGRETGLESLLSVGVSTPSSPSAGAQQPPCGQRRPHAHGLVLPLLGRRSCCRLHLLGRRRGFSHALALAQEAPRRHHHLLARYRWVTLRAAKIARHEPCPCTHRWTSTLLRQWIQTASTEAS